MCVCDQSLSVHIIGKSVNFLIKRLGGEPQITHLKSIFSLQDSNEGDVRFGQTGNGEEG